MDSKESWAIFILNQPLNIMKCSIAEVFDYCKEANIHPHQFVKDNCFIKENKEVALDILDYLIEQHWPELIEDKYFEIVLGE